MENRGEGAQARSIEGKCSARGRNGWSELEEKMLFEMAAEALENGMPVKSVFEKLAKKTGRRPNSIRNFYYLKRRESDDAPGGGFTPFSNDEVIMLLRVMLTGQAEGRSVRGIAMELGGGDKKLMLRYQNKYRSLLRSNQDSVRSVMSALASEGRQFFDPFCAPRRRSGIAAMIADIEAGGEDVRAVLSAIAGLSRKAGSLRHDPLKQKRINDIVALNRHFISLSGIERYSALGEYIAELESAIRELGSEERYVR